MRSEIAAKRWSACGDCHACETGRLERLGLKRVGYDYVVALAGNPNTGKSTIFNALTGLRQHVGNWPGKTVARAEGAYRYRGGSYKVVDLPGTYSLLSTSVDEEVARDFLLFGQPDVTVAVLDATRLERNLNLVLQVLEITGRAVVALNLMDEAERNGLVVDARSLARDLGVPVAAMAARRGEGVPELLSAIHDVARSSQPGQPHRVRHRNAGVDAAVGALADRIAGMYPGISNPRWVALRLLENDESIIRAVKDGTLGQIVDTEPGIPRIGRRIGAV